ncbi:MAG TPA: lactonase family protein [Gemmataceae bacterium]|nr:lactonase family protein [Gemmataceae bacterium]
MTAIVRGLFTAAVLLCASASASPAGEVKKDDKLWVYIGTYTPAKGKSEGIYRFELDLATGKASKAVLAAKTKDPSFLAIHPNHKFLYAVGEIDDFGGKKAGAISAFALDSKTGDLTLLNQQSSGGAGPCHLVLDKAGKHALAANYGGGSACVLPIGDDGKLGKASAIVQHKGSSADKSRQEAPHAHSINLDAANRYVFVADLGLDKVVIYRFDPEKGDLAKNDPPYAPIAPTSGPRHFAFHPNGKFAYVINELKNTVTAFDYDPKTGALKTIQTVPTLPRDFKGNSWTAEVVVHPSGKFLYGSNRGHNSLAIFAIDATTGKLIRRGHQAENIKTPRNFAIDPTGTYLLSANQDSGSVIIFRINQETGDLTPTGTVVDVPFPVCVRMMPKPR